jgi:hypothetical protein
MEIIVLPDGETYGVLEGCSIRRVPDGLSGEEIDELIARGGGEVIAFLEGGHGAARHSCQTERPPLHWPGRVWLADVHTGGPPAIEVFFPHEGAAARTIEASEAYYSAPAVQPLREVLERYANDPDLAADLGLAARDALARFAAMSGERRPGVGNG